MTEEKTTSQEESPRVSRFTRFFWFCAGANSSILLTKRCETERAKYAGIGATVLVTSALAMLSGGYALYAAFGSAATPAAVGFGILWGIVIFNFDRYIVLSMRKEKKGRWREFVTASPRLLAAALISTVITVPLELKLFQKEITDHLSAERSSFVADETRRITETYDWYITRLKNENEELSNKISNKDAEIKSLYQGLTDEENGTAPSGVAGQGPKFETRRQELDHAQEALKELKDQNLPRISKNSDGIKVLEDQRDEKIRSITTRNPEDAGFLKRIEALHSEARRSSVIAWTTWLVALLFMLIECSPVIVKLLAKYGPYDAVMERKERETVAYEDERIAGIQAWAQGLVSGEAEMNRESLDFEKQLYRRILQAVDSRQDFAEAEDLVSAELVRQVERRLLQKVRNSYPLSGSNDVRQLPLQRPGSAPPRPRHAENNGQNNGGPYTSRAGENDYLIGDR